jgi:hypothetical protein
MASCECHPHRTKYSNDGNISFRLFGKLDIFTSDMIFVDGFKEKVTIEREDSAFG